MDRDKLLNIKNVLEQELQEVNTHAGYMASADSVKRYIEKRIFQIEYQLSQIVPKREYSNPKHEEWALKQPMRYANGLAVSDTVIKGEKPNGEEK